jgi:uncharacterized repeat protein (TIGR01451 family)
MKTSSVLFTIATISVVTIASVSTAYAWHPKGIITKKVQNVTTGSVLSEADTAASAIAAKPGDTLKYVIEVRNDGAPTNNNHNDMAKTVMTDTLPAGIALASNPSQRHITENLGTLRPGEKVTKVYTVTVTTATNSVIKNTACFTGDSAANDNPQQGCNPAVVTVTVPPKPEEPVVVPPTPTPQTPQTPQTPVELPKTGAAESILGSAFVLGLTWYILHRYIASRRELTAKL